MRLHSITAVICILIGVATLLWAVFGPTSAPEQTGWRLIAALMCILTGVIIATAGAAAGKIIKEIRDSRQ